jgi:hypothetical protein
LVIFYSINITGGTANLDSDYIVSGSLDVTFQANDPSSKTIKLFILNDKEVESAETIILTIIPDAGINITNGTHTVTIEDDDGKSVCQYINMY